MLTMLFVRFVVAVIVLLSSSLLENSIHPLLLLNDVFPLHVHVFGAGRICIRLSIDLSLNWQFVVVAAATAAIITFFLDQF